MKYGLFFLALFSFSALSSDQCQILESLLIEEQVALSNIANVFTTRSESGGAYKVKTVRCQYFQCQVSEEKKSYLKYEPSHPDANLEGYVEYPQIDVQAQMQKLISMRRRYDYHARKTQFWSECEQAEVLLSKY